MYAPLAVRPCAGGFFRLCSVSGPLQNRPRKKADRTARNGLTSLPFYSQGDVGYDTWEGTYYVQTTPVKVMDDVAAVSCGATHTGIVKTDGTLWMCGNNGSGAVGNGGKGNDTSIIYTYQTVPVQVLSDVAMVQG